MVAAVHLDEIAVVQQGDGRPISGGEEGMILAEGDAIGAADRGEAQRACV
jgi:hypothetical protein